jgi:hypothetical protein
LLNFDPKDCSLTSSLIKSSRRRTIKKAAPGRRFLKRVLFSFCLLTEKRPGKISAKTRNTRNPYRREELSRPTV